MLIAGVIVLCIVLSILAFLAPRLSRHPERGVHAVTGGGGRAAGKTPGIGRWLRKPFDSATKWTGRSASKGRKGRSKLPL